MSLKEAVEIAKHSNFISRTISPEIRMNVLGQLDMQIQQYDLARSKDEFEDKTYFKLM